jgi:phosphatidate cytidylyltransferase
MGVREFYHGFETLNVKPSYGVAYISILGLYAINLFAPAEYNYYMLWFLTVILLSLLYLFKIDERELADAMATLTGVFYVVFLPFMGPCGANRGVRNLVWLFLITHLARIPWHTSQDWHGKA